MTPRRQGITSPSSSPSQVVKSTFQTKNTLFQSHNTSIRGRGTPTAKIPSHETNLPNQEHVRTTIPPSPIEEHPLNEDHAHSSARWPPHAALSLSFLSQTNHPEPDQEESQSRRQSSSVRERPHRHHNSVVKERESADVVRPRMPDIQIYYSTSRGHVHTTNRFPGG